jgi:hypothetical protein
MTDSAGDTAEMAQPHQVKEIDQVRMGIPEHDGVSAAGRHQTQPGQNGDRGHVGSLEPRHIEFDGRRPVGPSARNVLRRRQRGCSFLLAIDRMGPRNSSRSRGAATGPDKRGPTSQADRSGRLPGVDRTKGKGANHANTGCFWTTIALCWVI